MVDSRKKGARAENQAKQLLTQYTGLNWQKVPGSGALDPKHKLKGDLYIPDSNNVFCIEVKHYKDDHLTSKILTDKNPQLLKWWEQAVRQAEQVDKIPLLLFKFDRSKWFVAYTLEAIAVNESTSSVGGKYLLLICKDYNLYLQKLEDWLSNNTIKFVKQ